MSFESLTCCLPLVARPAQGFEIRIVIGTPMCFRFDVVNCLGFHRTLIAQAFLTQLFVTLQYSCAPDIPGTAIAALVSALTILMLLPTLIYVV